MAKSLPEETCKRCTHTWVRRILKPKVCPGCQSPYWDTERRVKVKLEPVKEAHIGTAEKS